MTQFRILHAALLASLIVYGVVAVVVKAPAPDDGRPAAAEAAPGAAAADAPDPGLFLPLFGGIAAVELLVVIPLLRRRLMPPRAAFPQPLEDVELDSDERAAGAIARLRSASIITWALAESVALFGLVAAFMLREWRYYLPFAAVAAVAMVYFAPRRALLDEVVRAARDQGTPG
jgi:hypothetical protein